MSNLVLTKSFDPTKTVNARWSRADFTPAGGAVVKISGKLFDPDSTLETAILEQPGADDLNREVAEVAIGAKDTVTLTDIEEIDIVIATLGGLNGLVLGAVDFYVKDPRDAVGAAGKVKYKVSFTSCSVRRPDGPVRMGGKDYSKTSLLFRNLSGVKPVWTVAAAAPDSVA